MIEDAMGEAYLRRWAQQTEEIHLALRSKTWFAFDLDDTLHGFRATSSTALESVLSKINADYGANVEKMQELYREILAEKRAFAFIDGRGSRDYRKERFETLMHKSNFTCTNEYLDDLADIHQQDLGKALRLKCGALDLLNMLKALNKKIVIVTESPEDAQVWTVEQLGIAGHVDFLATTNHFGVSKVDGLLRKVMNQLEISADDMVFVGDNWSRDMVPATDAGVYAVYYAETENISLDQMPIRINTLKKLQFLLKGVEGEHPEKGDDHV